MTMAHILDEGVPSLSFRLENSHSYQEAPTSGEGGHRRRVTMINGAMSSTLMG
jgi:hypothetical protein